MTQLILGVLEDARRIVSLIHHQAGRSLNELSEQIPSEKICVETLEKPSFDLFVNVVEANDVGICLDVGHLYWQGGGYADFLKHHGARVREVHLHDARQQIPIQGGGVLDHLPLGEGEINPANFLRQLSKMGYQGTVIVENNTRQDLERSLLWLDGWKAN